MADGCCEHVFGVHELLQLILSFLDEASLLNARRVCRAWCQVASERAMFKMLMRRSGLLRYRGLWTSADCDFLLKLEAKVLHPWQGDAVRDTGFVDLTESDCDTLRRALPGWTAPLVAGRMFVSGVLRWQLTENRDAARADLEEALGRVEEERVIGYISGTGSVAVLSGVSRSGMVEFGGRCPAPGSLRCREPECDCADWTTLYTEDTFDTLCDRCDHGWLDHNDPGPCLTQEHIIACDRYVLVLDERGSMTGRTFGPFDRIHWVNEIDAIEDVRVGELDLDSSSKDRVERAQWRF